MVGKIMRWLMRKAGLAYVTEEAFNAHNEAVTKMVLRNRETGFGLQESLRQLDDKVRLLGDCVQHLNEKLVELDSVIVSTMECVEEIKDKQLPAAPETQKADAAQILNEFFWGYQQPGGDDE